MCMKIPNLKKYIFANLFVLVGYVIIFGQVNYSITPHEPFQKGDLISDGYFFGLFIAFCGYILLFVLGLFVIEFCIRKFIIEKKFPNFKLKIHIPRFINIIHSVLFVIGFIPAFIISIIVIWILIEGIF